MHLRQSAIFALSVLAFLTAMAALSPIALLCGVFVVLTALWAAVRMPPFWRYVRKAPEAEDLAGVYELRSDFPMHEEFSLQLLADGRFHCERFPMFTTWPPIQIEEALAGAGQWSLTDEGKGEWTVTLALDSPHPVDVPGRPTASGGITVDHLEASFRIGRRNGAYTLLTWAGGFFTGRTVEFDQRVQQAAAALARDLQ